MLQHPMDSPLRAIVEPIVSASLLAMLIITASPKYPVDPPSPLAPNLITSPTEHPPAIPNEVAVPTTAPLL